MRILLLSIVFLGLSTGISIAQDIHEEQNYKHTHNPEEDYKNGMFTSDTVTLMNQKTHKRSSGRYVLAPCDSLPPTNVQGKKHKANYKNQFN
jgi:hypothetical protein